MKILEEIYEFFSRINKIRKSRSRTITFLVAILFLGSLVIGFIYGILYVNAPSAGTKDSCPVGPSYLIESKQFALFAFFIFLNNLRVSFLLTLSGLTLVLMFPFIIYSSVLEGFLYGICFSLIPTNITFMLIFFVGVFSVAFLEYTAVILASVEGFYLGTSLFFPRRLYGKKMKRKDAFLKTANQSSYIYVLIVMILALAAVLETLLIAL